jgi:hypothetical protein
VDSNANTRDKSFIYIELAIDVLTDGVTAYAPRQGYGESAKFKCRSKDLHYDRGTSARDRDLGCGHVLA